MSRTPFARPVWSALARVWDHLLSRPAAFTSPPPTPASQPVRLALLPLEERVVPTGRPLPIPMLFTGTESGLSLVRAYRAETGELAFEKQPFASSFGGGVRVAAGDIDHDGMPDLIAAAGPGGGPHVKVYSGKTGELIGGPLGSFYAYDPAFGGGVYVAGGDVDGDGQADVITAAGAGGGPHVKAFSGRTGQVIASFYAYAPHFQGGATIAAADLTGDGKVEVITGAGAGGGPHVKAFDLNKVGGPAEVLSFYAFAPTFTGGVSVGADNLAGDVSGDGVADIAVGSGAGGPSRVKVFSGTTGTLVRDFAPFPAAFTGGVRVAVAYVDDDAQADIFVGTGAGTAGTVKVFSGATAKELPAPMSPYTPFGGGYTGGLFVAGSNDPEVPTVTAVASPSTVPGGGAITVTVDVADSDPSNGVQTPTGVVVVSWFGSNPSLTLTPVSTGLARAVFNLTASSPGGPLPPGTYPWYVSYTGDSHFANLHYVGGNPITVTGSPPPPPPPAVPLVSVEAGRDAYEEGSNDGLFVFRRTVPDPATDTGLTLTFETLGGTATNLTDYELAGTAYFAPQATVAYVRVDPYTDLVADPDEYVRLGIADHPSYVVDEGYRRAVVFITDDQAADRLGPTCGECDAGSPADTLGGADTGGSQKLSSGVRADGMVRVNLADLGGERAGSAAAGVLQWTNLSGYADQHGGQGTRLADVPRLLERDGGGYTLADGGYSATPFVPSGGGLVPAFGGPATLTSPNLDHLLLTDGAGNTLVFNSYLQDVPYYLRGQLVSRTDAAGRSTTFEYETDPSKHTRMGLPKTATWTDPTTGATEWVEYGFAGFGDGAKGYQYRLAGFTRFRLVGGTGKPVESLAIQYTLLPRLNPPPGGLTHTPVVSGTSRTVYADYQTPAAVGDTYNRYYAGGEANGFEQGLKFHLGEKAVARLRAAYPWASDLDTLSDSQVTTYADLRLEYDSQRRVSKIVRAGEGCSACAGGLGGAVLGYAASGNTPEVNTWAGKTTETLDDGTVNAVYANAWGQVLLAATTEAGTGKTWATYTRYDAAGRPVLVAAPSAVSGFAEAFPDLVGYSGGDAYFLRDAVGLVRTFAYPAATTATDTVAGEVHWLASSGWLHQGEFGGGVKQWERAYLARTAGGFASYHLAAESVFRYADGTGAQTTTYAYDWLTGTHHAHTVTTTLPAVTTARNGPGSAVSVTWVVNTDGRMTWLKDAAGFLTHYQYDPASGGMTLAVSDVNATVPYEYSGLPAGWSTPAGGGLHQLSRFEVDAFARGTKATDPRGRVTYTAYKDAEHEVRVYRGWAGYQTTGPIQVYREDWGRGYAEWLSMATYPTLDMSGRPTGTEGINGVQSLARAHTNPAGQTVAVDAYFDLGWAFYTEDPTIGAAGVNYLRTEYGYDKRGRANKTIGPDGVIGRTVYDALGRPVSSWVGTNDTPASGWWSPSNPAGMVKLADAEYDAGGIGDSLLTALTVYPGHGRAARRTETAYDWRNRPVAVKEAVEAVESESVNRPLVRYAYDNLDQLLAATVYDGDTVPVSTVPATSRRRGETAFSYDEYGRVYRTDRYAANQTTGTLAAPLTDEVWFDVRGLAVKTRSADGQVLKWQYDSLGRTAAGFLTDGGGDASWLDAHGLTGDTVWSQTEFVYDIADQLLQTNTRSRAFGAVGTGPLGTPTAGVQARVTSAGYYYDLAGRLTDAVDVGTNGGAPWARPATVPARSDTALVTSVAYDDAGRPQDVTDPRGITARTTSDLLGRLTTTTAAYGTADALTTAVTYDTAGRLLDVTAPGGRTTRSLYDAWGRGTGVTERFGTALARTSTVALDDLGGTLTATDPLGTVTAFTENVLGRVTAVTAASGTALARTASATFDVFGRTLTTTNPRNFVTAYAYDDPNRAVTVTDAAGYAWTTAFDQAGRVTSATNPFGHTTTVGYDLPGRVVSVTDPLNQTTTFQHNVDSGEDRTLNPLGHTTRTLLDRFGRTASVADPLNNVTSFGYDRNSNPVSVTNAKGVATAFAYDSLNRVTGVTEAVGKAEQRSTAYAYTAAGDLASVTDPLGRQTTFAYDAAGRTTGQTLAAGTADAFTVSAGYDLLDRVVSVTRPGNRTTGYAYDALSQLTKATEGVGTSLERHTTFAYDAGGNRTAVTGPLGFTTATAYDALDRVSGITDANGGLVQVAYDKAGRTASLTDPTGNVTSWGYDAAGRTTAETDPRGKTTAYGYDPAGRLTSATDRIGRVREFGYDNAGRLTSETWKTGGSTVQSQTFGYDAVGNQTSATDPDGSSMLTYDNLNRVVSVAGPWGVTQTFGYDAADNRTSTSDNKGGGSTSTYDHLDRLKTRTQSATGMTTVQAAWAYTAAGDVDTVTRSAGGVPAGTTANSYDALGRLVGIAHKNAAGTSVGAYAYGFDAGDRLTSETFNGTTRTFGYDKLGQLTNDNGTLHAYDKSGNRTGGGYVTGTGNRTTSDGTWAYTYDDAGQMTGKSKGGEAWAYTYDHRGRMTGASKSATPGGAVTDSVSYKMDAWGNRIERAQAGGTSATQRYAVDGWDTAKPGAAGTEGFEAVMDLDGSNAVTARRVFGAGFDEAAARQDAGGGVTWYGADGLGSVRQVFDNSGNTTGSQAFTGFGVTTATSGAGQDRYAYSGTVTDPLTGLVGDDARQYDPTLGKWMSDDPIGFGGGDTNVSRYGGNSPTNGRDPSGFALLPTFNHIPIRFELALEIKFNPERVETSVVHNLIRTWEAVVESDDVLPDWKKPKYFGMIKGDYSAGRVYYGEVSNDRVHTSIILEPVLAKCGARDGYHGYEISHYRVVSFLQSEIPGDESLDSLRARLVVAPLGRGASKEKSGRGYGERVLARYAEGLRLNKQLEVDLLAAQIARVAIHMVPFGGSIDYLYDGKYLEAGLSAVGDVGILVSTAGVGMLAKGAKAGRTLYLVGQGMQGAVATTQVIRAIDAYNKGEKEVGNLFLSDAGLRLLGMTVSATLKVRCTIPAKAPSKLRNVVMDKGIAHAEVKHLSGDGPVSLKTLDPRGTREKWVKHITVLAENGSGGTVTKLPTGEKLDLMAPMPLEGGGHINVGVSLFRKTGETEWVLTTILTRQ